MVDNYSIEKLREQEREARKQLILDAAINLFSTCPLSKVSIRDIAKKAGVSPALIYRHFEDRDALFLDVFLIQSDKIISSFETLLQRNEDFTTHQVAEEFVTYLLDHRNFFQMMTHFMLDSSKNEMIQEKFNSNVRRLLAAFDYVLQESGIAKKTRIHSHAFLAALNGVVITYINYPGRSEAEIREHILHVTKIIATSFEREITNEKR